MSFERGLWVQWKNRFAHNVQYPLHIYFMEQFRTSPLINHKDIKENRFQAAMKQFYKNAIERNELVELPLEVFWSIAYGPLYSLIRFHVGKKSPMGKNFVLTEEKMKQAFDAVIKALKK